MRRPCAKSSSTDTSSATCESASTLGMRRARRRSDARCGVTGIAATRERPGEFGLGRADDQREHRVECGEAVGIGETPAAKCGDERVGYGESGRRRRAARQHERNGCGMRADTQPHRLGHRVNIVDPVRGRLGHPHLRDDRGDDQFLQPLLVGDVVVHRHRSGAQRSGQCAHAQRAHAGVVNDAQRRGGDLIGGEPCAQSFDLLDKYAVREAV